MCLYEVNIEVREQILAPFCHWLKDHVAEMLRLPGFLQAEIFHQVDPESPKEWRRMTVHYYLQDHQALQYYLENHAPHMRRDGQTRFGEDFKTSRRTLLKGTPS